MKEMYLYLYRKMTCGMKRLRQEERGAVDIVAIVVMIGIAVALAVIFKDQISGLLNTLFGTITSTATSAIN